MSAADRVTVATLGDRIGQQPIEIEADVIDRVVIIDIERTEIAIAGSMSECRAVDRALGDGLSVGKKSMSRWTVAIDFRSGMMANSVGGCTASY